MAILETSDIYLESLKRHAQNTKIQEKINKFVEAKTAVPPRKLPNGMRDHTLDKKLTGLRECHLDGDILLVYSSKKGKVRLIWICNHDELWSKVVLINRHRY